MNSAHMLESAVEVPTHTHVEAGSTEVPIEALATKVFALTIAYVGLFILAAVLLIAL
jgi:hypothetical protein